MNLILLPRDSYLMCIFPGMNSAVRAVARMGIYVGCKVYLIKEVHFL